MKLLNFFVIAFFVNCFCLSCKKTIPLSEQPSFNLPEKKSNSEYKRDFARILVAALKSNESFRKLIKEEALVQFDNDYDVFYENIKYKKIGTGETVRELLIKSSNETTISKIENNVPLLTIFVPTLPDKSFSADIWNPESQIPEVAVVQRETPDILIYRINGEPYVLQNHLIPSYPVIVIKDNERVKFIRSGLENIKDKSVFFQINDRSFAFIDKCFNKKFRELNKHQYRYTTSLDQKVIDAFNIYRTGNGWQRDYIYYNITPTNPNGQFTYNFKEHITDFSLAGDPTAIYNKIADQTGEPRMLSISTNPNGGWTGGNFEFKISVLFNAKNGLGTLFETYFNALPTDLFAVTYKKSFIYYVINTVSLKTMPLTLPLFNWDLNQYAATIKIDVAEVDVTENITESQTVTTKFATNFSIDGGILKKIGLKFGASLETTNSSTFQKTYSLGSDQLGSVIVNFADNVLIGQAPTQALTWHTQEYSSGQFKLTIEPLRVQ